MTTETTPAQLKETGESYHEDRCSISRIKYFHVCICCAIYYLLNRYTSKRAYHAVLQDSEIEAAS